MAPRRLPARPRRAGRARGRARGRRGGRRLERRDAGGAGALRVAPAAAVRAPAEPRPAGRPQPRDRARPRPHLPLPRRRCDRRAAAARRARADAARARRGDRPRQPEPPAPGAGRRPRPLRRPLVGGPVRRLRARGAGTDLQELLQREHLGAAVGAPRRGRLRGVASAQLRYRARVPPRARGPPDRLRPRGPRRADLREGLRPDRPRLRGGRPGGGRDVPPGARAPPPPPARQLLAREPALRGAPARAPRASGADLAASPRRSPPYAERPAVPVPAGLLLLARRPPRGARPRDVAPPDGRRRDPPLPRARAAR